MTAAAEHHSGSSEKAARQAARRLVAAYHQEQLQTLLEHVRVGFARLDGGEIDEFQLDELIHRYKKAAAKLWAFCGSGGARIQQAADHLAYLQKEGRQPPDWWEEAAPRSRD